MSEQQPEATESTESEATEAPTTNVEGNEQVVVNNAPDGGGVDNNEGDAESSDSE